MKQVLVVDDNEVNRYLLRALLQGNGYAVEEAVQGAEALAKARASPPDLVISDLLMPEMDGYTLLRHWREDERLRAIPFIVYTATYTDPRDEHLAMALGADAFIVKPAEPEMLLARIVEALDMERRGALRKAPPPQLQETLLLKEYNEVLVRKLEKKALELERTNRELSAEIAERRRAEDRLRESEERFRATFEQAAVGIAHVDVDGRFLRVNDKLCEITGYSRDELLGFTFADLTLPEDSAGDDGARQAMLDGSRRLYSVEKRYRTKGGGAVWVNIVTTLARGRGELTRYFITVVVDITERKTLEEQFRQAQKMEAVGRLAGGVAHDFNNLLTVIFGFTDELLAQEDLGRQTHDAARAINQAGERAAALTAKLLGFSRRSVLQPKVIDLNAAIDARAPLLHRLIGEDVALDISLAPELSPVRMDPVQLDQVLMNLAVNARDAMPTGGRLAIATSNVTVGEGQVSAHPDCQPGLHVLLRVSDTGCGMSAEVLGHIFEPFFTTKEAGRGTGLGLAMVFGIVRQSGGCVHVQSEPDRGSSFEIYLPAALQEAVAPRPQLADTEIGGPETVLLVEDEEGVRDLALRAFQAHGYKVLAAGDGEEALAIARDHDGPIVLVVTDVVMPKLSGPEMVERLKARFPGLRVLYMSGYTDDAMLRHGLLEAAVSYIQKPFTPLGLVRKAREVLDGLG